MGLNVSRSLRSRRLIYASVIVLLLAGGFVAAWMFLAGTDSRSSFYLYGAPHSELGGAGSGGTAYGDVNGDGYDDLLVSSGSRHNAGTVHIVYGGGDLRGLKLDVRELDERTKGAMIVTDQRRWAPSMTVADFNGDGSDDVAVCASVSDMEEVTTEFCVLLGTPHFLAEEIALAGNGDQVNRLRIITNRDDAYIGGGAMAAGDVNGDGFSDLILMEVLRQPPGVKQIGTFYVVYGRRELPEVITLSAESIATVITGEEEIITRGTLASGDLNGDGFDDVLIGWGESQFMAGGNPDGGVHIVFGASTLPGKRVELKEPKETKITRLLEADYGDNVGGALAVGDVNGDGFDDVILGAPGTEPPGWQPTGYEAVFSPETAGNLGTVFIVYGSSSLPGAEILLDGSSDDHKVTSIRGTEEGMVGRSVGSDDVNADGREDVLFGASIANRGMLMAVQANQLTHGEVHWDSLERIESMAGDNRKGHFGYAAMGGGDMDRDGFGDFAAAAPYAANWGGYVKNIFGAGDSPSATAVERFQPGNTQSRGFGGRLSPVLRCWIAFTGGDQESPVTVTLTRSAEGVAELTDLAKVVWEISTPRTGWTNAKIRLQYTDAEIAGLEEDTLALYQAPALSGPWRSVSNAQLNSHKNEFTAEVAEFGFFALLGTKSE